MRSPSLRASASSPAAAVSAAAAAVTSVVAFSILATTVTASAATGPGMPRMAFHSGDLFKPISTIASKDCGHGNVTMYDGYLFVIYARDSGVRGGGLSFWDISNPRNPILILSGGLN